MDIQSYSRQYVALVFLFTYLHNFSEAIAPVLYPIGVAAFGVIGGVYEWWKCPHHECCNKKWTMPENKSKNIILDIFEKELFGQHLVMQTVPSAVYNHIYDENPQKALVMSLHGWSGCGKNHVANLLSKYIYREGANSMFVHTKIATKDYPDPNKVNEYRIELESFVRNKTMVCGRSLFIFDEMDKMPSGLTDVLKPYIDYHYKVDGVDYRKNIFLFLNNLGGDQISKVALKNWIDGNTRESLNTSSMEKILSITSLKLQGGFQHSALIVSGLVDFFIPLLPLERVHVMQCAAVQIKRQLKTLRELQEQEGNKENRIEMDRDAQRDVVKKVVDEIQFYPEGEDIFAQTGCKQVKKKVDMFV